MNSFVRCIALAAAALTAASSLRAAEPPGLSRAGRIDPSPGADIYSPFDLALNRTSHKLYVRGGPHSYSNVAIKIFDTATQKVVGAIDFGPANGSPDTFRPLAVAVDDSPGPDGNKLYVVGSGLNAVLRVIDGETDASLTDANSDVVLPLGSIQGVGMAVNPTNHKVYVARADGRVVVVHGPSRQVIKTLNTDGGGFLAVDPIANKVFVLGQNGGAVIDSATDTVTAPPQPLSFNPWHVSFDEVTGHLFFVGTAQNFTYGVFVLDGSTGQLVRSRTGFQQVLPTISVVPGENSVYVGVAAYQSEPARIEVLNASDLSTKGSLPHAVTDLEYDPIAADKLLAVGGALNQHVVDAVYVLDRGDGSLRAVSVGHEPRRLLVNSRTNRLYIREAAPLITVVDAHSRTAVARIDLPAGAGEPITLSERLNRIYVTRTAPVTYEQFVDVFDGATNTLRSSIRCADGIKGVAVDDTRRRLYVSGVRPGTGFQAGIPVLQVFDADTETHLTTVVVGPNTFLPQGDLAVNPVTGRIIYYSSGLTVVDGNTLTVLGTIPVAGSPKMCFNLKTNKLYIPNGWHPDGRGITIVDGATNTLEKRVSTGGVTTPTGVAIDEATNTFYVNDVLARENTSYHRIAAFDAGNDYVFVGDVDIGPASADLVFNPVTRQLFAPEVSGDATIAVFQASGTSARDQLGNLSTRLRVGGGDEAMISGFIVEAAEGETKKVIVRAVGPSLETAGVPGALADTTLELHTAAGDVITNDDWQIDAAFGESQQAQIEATGLAPADEREAAVIAELPAGAHTVVIRGKDGATGVGLAEVFILDHDSPARLANMSTRGAVGTGDNVMIGGVIVSGSTASRVLVRAIAPSLQDQLSAALSDPVLELRDINGGLIEMNDDWKSTHEAEIAATTIPPNDERESAIAATLAPGNYTAIVRGKDGATGVALVEAYHLP